MLFPSGANWSEFLLPGVVVTCFDARLAPRGLVERIGRWR